MYSENTPNYSQTPTPNSNMALISLIAGILGLTFIPTIGSIVALITGYMARKEINESGGMLGGSGMATGGIILGFIGLALTCCGIIFVLLVIFGAFGAIWTSSSQLSLPFQALFSLI